MKAEKVALTDYVSGFSLTGEIKARSQTDLAFRLGGKIISRSVEVGDHVSRDQVIARLDAQDQQASIDSARAALAAAEADLAQARATFDRQQSLMGQQLTTRRDFDQAEANFRTAAANLEATRARLANAQEQLGFTELKASTDGIVTARHIEAGQVVAQGQRIFTIAADGERDAVFQVDEQVLVKDPTGLTIDLHLLSDPSVVATGIIREVAPAVDPQTGTVTVKISLARTPPAMTLGAAVSGSPQIAARPMVILPWNALYEADGKPAVWLVDRTSTTVMLRSVEIERYDSARIIVASGLSGDEWVVTAGNQNLSPGQKVTIIEEPAPGARP